MGKEKSVRNYIRIVQTAKSVFMRADSVVPRNLAYAHFVANDYRGFALKRLVRGVRATSTVRSKIVEGVYNNDTSTSGVISFSFSVFLGAKKASPVKAVACGKGNKCNTG